MSNVINDWDIPSSFSTVVKRNLVRSPTRLNVTIRRDKLGGILSMRSKERLRSGLCIARLQIRSRKLSSIPIQNRKHGLTPAPFFARVQRIANERESQDELSQMFSMSEELESDRLHYGCFADRIHRSDKPTGMPAQHVP